MGRHTQFPKDGTAESDSATRCGEINFANTLGIITDYVEEHEVPYGRCGGNLALVHSRILPLSVPDPQRPFLRVRRVHRLEPLVRRVCVSAHCQQMDVTMSHPGHLLIGRAVNE